MRDMDKTVKEPKVGLLTVDDIVVLVVKFVFIEKR
jgi:hypothetical protein